MGGDSCEEKINLINQNFLRVSDFIVSEFINEC